MPDLDLTVVIVSFNTRDLLRQCLETVLRELDGLRAEIIVVDNGSSDDSSRMVAAEFPSVHLLDHGKNIGFGAANNLAIRQARGRYIVLLNSDAFPLPGALRLAVQHMDATPKAGMGGGQLSHPDGTWQPSAHAFPNLLYDVFLHTGLAYNHRESRLFGRMDRSWDTSGLPAQVDWITGAFIILRPQALQHSGYFDEEFFLYFEEVDLCRRVKYAGYQIWFWPDVRIHHLGGASARSQDDLQLSRTGSQILLWHLRSQFLYYRRYHGSQARLIMLFEWFWFWLRALHNEHSQEPHAAARAEYCRTYIRVLRQAWFQTMGGRFSPPRPWA